MPLLDESGTGLGESVSDLSVEDKSLPWLEAGHCNSLYSPNMHSDSERHPAEVRSRMRGVPREGI